MINLMLSFQTRKTLSLFSAGEATVVWTVKTVIGFPGPKATCWWWVLFPRDDEKPHVKRAEPRNRCPLRQGGKL